jgi:MoaA/NifB/PqqE/SkfB family radical SAM enzyme
MIIPDRPLEVIWDITYACPLRCFHCYSESGRRPTRQLDRAQLRRAADAIISLQPYAISLAGGEPLLVADVFEVAARFAAAGVKVALFTGGWSLRPDMIDQILQHFFRVSVSVDGSTADVHDRIRGRRGSHERALTALTMLDQAIGRRRLAGRATPDLGIDYVVVRSNAHQVEETCADVAVRFPRLSYLSFGAVVPEGLANRAGFAEHELLFDSQVELLGSPAYADRLRSLAPASVQVTATDNLALQMRPDLIADGLFFPAMQIEPDGQVRAMPAYEGTIGNLLTDSAPELWRRAVARWHHPFVVETLTPVRTMREWAAASRKIDYYFGTASDRARIDRRPAFV